MISFHLGDLHLGKKVKEFSMIEDQKYILNQIIDEAKNHKVDTVFISGDVFDKPIPPAEALKLFEDFCEHLRDLDIQIFMISGNHDSAERLSYGRRIFAKEKLYISDKFMGEVEVFSVQDDFGTVNIHLLPFLKPSHCFQYFEEEISTYEDAIKTVLKHHNINKDERNVLLSHQFVTWNSKAEESESEINPIGGIDKIDASAFFDFDYVALGHLHSPQRIGRDNIRFAGSPLAYSFSEIRNPKMLTKVILNQKGDVQVELIPLKPLRKMREIKGELQQILDVASVSDSSDDYIKVTLTDKTKQFDPLAKLRNFYPNIMTLDFDYTEENQNKSIDFYKQNMNPIELFSAFYYERNEKNLSAEQLEIVEKFWQNRDEVAE